jgi:cytochrome P450
VALVDFHILDPDVLQRGVPHDAYREIRRREPVYWQELPEGAGYWALSKHADVQRVSRDPATFSANARGVNLVDDIHDLPTLLSLDPPEHTEMRRRVLYAFTPKVVRSLEPRMREIVRRALDRATDLRECDFVRDLAAPLPLEVIGDILGVPAADRAMVGRWADTLAGSADPEVGAGLEGKGPNQAALEFGTYAFQLGQKRADRGEREGHDLISVLLDAELDGTQVDLPTFAGLFVQIAIAGNETTRSLLSGGYLELMRRPRDCAALAADPSLVPAAVEEMLRWVSPVHYFRRTATRDVVVRGQEIAAGDRVVMLYASANRDEEVFREPDTFDIRRDPNPHVAFGFGEHFCLGAALGRLEARVFIEEFFQRFAAIELVGDVERLRSNELNSIERRSVSRGRCQEEG